MIRLINCHTGTEMWVSDDRKEEYLAAGHKLAADADVEETSKPVSKKKQKK